MCSIILSGEISEEMQVQQEAPALPRSLPEISCTSIPRTAHESSNLERSSSSNLRKPTALAFHQSPGFVVFKVRATGRAPDPPHCFRASAGRASIRRRKCCATSLFLSVPPACGRVPEECARASNARWHSAEPAVQPHSPQTKLWYSRLDPCKSEQDSNESWLVVGPTAARAENIRQPASSASAQIQSFPVGHSCTRHPAQCASLRQTQHVPGRSRVSSDTPAQD